MKKLLLSCAVLIAAVSSQAKVGDDLTSTYLQNADFSQDTTVTGRICTYDYDMANGTYPMFGQQRVTGWTALYPSDNVQVMQSSSSPIREDGANSRAGGVFAVGSEEAELGGTYYAPETSSTGDGEGNVLGLIAVWSATIQYTQEVVLPAGCYTITIPTYNAASTGTIAANLFGFIAEDGTAYTCDVKSWGNVGEWEDQTVTFILDQETKGVISLGYAASAGGSGSMPHLFIDAVKIEEGDPLPIIQAQIDALKEKLLELLEAADELSVNASAEQAVYDNDAATLAQVQAAIDSLKDKNANAMTDFTDFFINNAHFALGNALDNAVCTYAKDKGTNGTTYSGMQPIVDWVSSDGKTDVDAKASGLFAVGGNENVWMGGKGYVSPKTKANGATEGNVFGFVSCWGATAYYYQQVTLPAGSYTITIPTYNSVGGTSAIAKNYCGFISDDGTEHLATTTTFPVGEWRNDTIKFKLDEETSGKFTIGYQAANTGSGNMPHLFIDEFTLMFNGKTDISPSLIALNGAIRNGQNLQYTEESCEAAAKTALEEAVSAGDALAKVNSADDAANIAATTAINNAIVNLNSSIETYKTFNNFIKGQLTTAIEKYKEGDLSSFSESLEELKETYTSAYEDGAYSSAQIAEAQDTLKAMVLMAVTEAFETAKTDGKEHNLDISVLFSNLDYANSTVDGWQNETSTGAFLSRVQTAEVWNQSNFNVYKQLENLPAGAYEIRNNGFYRTAGNADNYTLWKEELVEGYAYLYAGSNKVLMHNVAEYAADKDENHTGPVDGDAESATLFVPNSNNNANYIFYTQKEALNSVTAALAEEGDLTVGVKGVDLSGDAWAVWGAVSVIFKGQNQDMMAQALNDEITELVQQAEALQEDDFVATIQQAVNQLTSAVEGGNAAKEGEISVKAAAITSLKEAIDYSKKIEGVKTKLMDIVNLYVTISEDYDFASTDQTFSALLETDAEGEFESIEAMQQIIDALPGAWVDYVMAQEGVQSASEQAPFEVTPLILNPSFENADLGLSVWNVQKNGDTGIRDNSNATYTMEGCDGDYLFNTWNGGTTGYAISQEVYLPKGYYTLTFTAATDSAKVLKINAEGTEVYSDSITTISPKEVGAELSLTFASQGEKITLGASAVDTWYKVDNFRLFYLGTVAPTAIENVAVEPQNVREIYDLQGRKAVRAKKGIYIINRKAVLVR